MKKGFGWSLGPFEIIDQLGPSFLKEHFLNTNKNIPTLLDDIGEKKLALQYLKRLVKILEKDGMYHLGHEQLYASVGGLYRYAKNYKESEKYYTKSIKNLKKKNSYKDSIQIILGLVEIKILLSKYQEAENLLKEVEKILYFRPPARSPGEGGTPNTIEPSSALIIIIF